MTARKAAAKDEEAPEEAAPEEAPPEKTVIITTPEEDLGEPPVDAGWDDPNTYPDPENPPRSP